MARRSHFPEHRRTDRSDFDEEKTKYAEIRVVEDIKAGLNARKYPNEYARTDLFALIISFLVP